MGSCTRRHFLLSTCFLQMITIIERQVFDFLGYMWAPIFVNFFHILFIIFGFYGAYHFRIKYIITYLIWNFLWIGWNAFLICFYLNVGTLDRDSDLLNLGTGSVSWFEVNGYGCKPTYNTNITSEDPFRPIRPERVDDCLLTYDIVEVVHSGVQCIFAFFGILGAILISYIFLDEDDRFDFMNGDAKSPQHTVVHPMYVSYTSIPTSASATMLSNKHHHQHSLHHSLNNSNHHLSNSSHALATTTNSNNTTTPTAAKKQFRTSSSSSQQPYTHHHHHQQLSSLHRQFSNNSNTNAAAAAAAGPNATSNNNLLLLTNNFSNSNNNKNNSHNNSNSNRHNATATATTNSNTFLIHTHKSNRSNPNNNSQYNLNSKGLIGGGGPGGSGSAAIGGGYTAGGSYNGSLLSNSSQYHQYNNGPVGVGSGRRSRQPLDLSPMSTSYNTRSYSTNNSNASNSMLYSPKQARKMSPLTSNSIFPANTATAIDLVQKQTGGGGGQLSSYYDDSTAKADHQFYVNGGGSRRHILMGGGASVSTPTQDTTPSLSYASLQNSNQNLNSSLKNQRVGGLGSGMNTSLSNSNYSLTNSLNNNHPPSPAPSALGGGSNSGRFARIHSKPKPPKSSSYSNFSNSNLMTPNGNSAAQPQTPVTRNERPLSSSNFDETFEDDNFSMQNLKPDEDITYVPFGKPTPGSYFVNKENNNLPSFGEGNNQQSSSGPSPNNNNPQFVNGGSPQPPLLEGGGILLEKGAILHPHPDMNPAQRVIYQQNGLPFHPAYSPVPYRQNSACSQQGPPRPTNIPLPIVPASYNHQCTEMISPSEVTPPPPPQPRPHIFQPRTGTAPYPDLSPDVTERYAMPTQYIPRSPVASRIARRQRQQQQHNHHNQQQSNHNNSSVERSHTSANFCDQIRDTPPGYRIHKGVAIKSVKPNEPQPPSMVRARSHDRLSDSHNKAMGENHQQAPENLSNGGGEAGGVGGSFKNRDSSAQNTPQRSDISQEMAPHVNRRSGRRGGEIPKPRPRSYCNSMSGGEGVIRGNIASDRKMGYAGNGAAVEGKMKMGGVY
ncbi:sodium/potassium-transporting ATPase subunit beta-1-interacting protein isoform X1 [Musca autumnalis]|uniref:sodium/potassium-transporting ATPase subunit beta-1-interacting protein isoform X1 n=1 Tax=Musca autumnalis TaxID=221902 RepID=UPI003CF8875D